MTRGNFGNHWMAEEREKRLVLAAQQGDRQAFLSLVKHYQRQVYGLAYALTRDHDHAADLAHDAFRRAWAGIKGIPEGKRFFPWLLRTTRNLSLTHARRRAGEPTSMTALGRIPVAPESEDADAYRLMLETLRELRPDEQMALALRVVERLPYEEIARLLDHSAGITLARLSSARGVLLARAGQGGGGSV